MSELGPPAIPPPPMASPKPPRRADQYKVYMIISLLNLHIVKIGRIFYTILILILFSRLLFVIDSLIF